MEKMSSFTVICLLSLIFTTKAVSMQGKAIGLCPTEAGLREYRFYEICCGGQLKPRLRYQECCGDKIYYKNTQICCDDQIEEKFLQSNNTCENEAAHCPRRTCCGKKMYKSEDIHCCDDRAVFKNASSKASDADFFTCCGTEILDTRTHFCCGEKILPHHDQFACCGEKVYDRAAEKCFEHRGDRIVLSKYQEMCGQIRYNMREQGCCAGTLHDVPELDKTNLMKRNPEFRCCDHVLMEKGKKCCRKHHYGYESHTIPDTEQCCGNASYKPEYQKCIDGKVTQETICGNEILPDTKKCCSELLPYDPTIEQCCQGSGPHPDTVISMEQSCCNGEGFDSATQLCCHNTAAVNKRDSSDNECCYNYRTDQYAPYNIAANEQCIDGFVQSLPLGAEVCGTEYYFSNSHLCCVDIVYQKNETVRSCCGNRAYSSDTQICCGGVLHDISSEEGSCCEGRFYSKNDGGNPCRCSDEIIDKKNQLCCQGVVHTIGSDAPHLVCCGRDVINRRRKQCCGDQFSYTRTKTRKCCGDREIYSKKSSFCNKQGLVVPRSKRLRNQHDVQRLCHSQALKGFDSWVRYSCTSKYVIKGKLEDVEIRRARRKINLELTVSDISSLDRGQGFSEWKGAKSLVFKIAVPRNKRVKCRKRYFTRHGKEIIIFFNEKAQNGFVRIRRHSHIFMTRYRVSREKSITSKLNHDFCRKKFPQNDENSIRMLVP